MLRSIYLQQRTKCSEGEKCKYWAMKTCDYCLVDLSEANWPAAKMKKNDMVCRSCATRIAQGKMNRSDRKKNGRAMIEEMAKDTTPLRSQLPEDVLALLLRPYEVTTLEHRDGQWLVREKKLKR